MPYMCGWIVERDVCAWGKGETRKEAIAAARLQKNLYIEEERRRGRTVTCDEMIIFEFGKCHKCPSSTKMKEKSTGMWICDECLKKYKKRSKKAKSVEIIETPIINVEGYIITIPDEMWKNGKWSESFLNTNKKPRLKKNNTLQRIIRPESRDEKPQDIPKESQEWNPFIIVISDPKTDKSDHIIVRQLVPNNIDDIFYDLAGDLGKCQRLESKEILRRIFKKKVDKKFRRLSDIEPMKHMAFYVKVVPVPAAAFTHISVNLLSKGTRPQDTEGDFLDEVIVYNDMVYNVVTRD